jgi:hypothetical protein
VALTPQFWPHHGPGMFGWGMSPISGPNWGAGFGSFDQAPAFMPLWHSNVYFFHGPYSYIFFFFYHNHSQYFMIEVGR